MNLQNYRSDIELIQHYYVVEQQYTFSNSSAILSQYTLTIICACTRISCLPSSSLYDWPLLSKECSLHLRAQRTDSHLDHHPVVWTCCCSFGTSASIMNCVTNLHTGTLLQFLTSSTRQTATACHTIPVEATNTKSGECIRTTVHFAPATWSLGWSLNTEILAEKRHQRNK